jgi:hypothetical protein
MPSTQPKKTLIVCDVQPDIAQKIPCPRLWVDLTSLAVQAARQHSNVKILYTQLRFDREQLEDIPITHRRLGILRKLSKTALWFTTDELCVAPHESENVLRRTTFLPHSGDPILLEALKVDDMASQEYALIGYGPTVQALSHLLGDTMASPCIQWIREGIQEENGHRRQALLDHGSLFNEQVISMVDYLESLDVLHTQILPPVTATFKPAPVKYVCDVGRGGHLSLFLHYLTNEYGYVVWPTQPWYQEQKSMDIKQYHCPLGRQIVDLCDEPQFGSGIRLFLPGRKYMDEKDLLHDLVPELMPPTFSSIQEAHSHPEKTLWFLKKVNQNGGRAVQVLLAPPDRLEADDQLQAHVPRPLLWNGGIKCHIKTYQWIGCTQEQDTVKWQVYQHDLYYLATASQPWSIEDTSDEVQITTMRTQRLYRHHPWRIQWNLTELCQRNIQLVLRRAVEQGKLQVEAKAGGCEPTTLQFEIHSADWMLDEDGRMYLIECNGIPVLYDPGQKQPLVTRGLQLYDRLYKENPDAAVVNDHELMKDAVHLAIRGTPPKDSLWIHVHSIPVTTECQGQEILSVAN